MSDVILQIFCKAAKDNKDKPGPDISSIENQMEKRKCSRRSCSSAMQYNSKVPTYGVWSYTLEDTTDTHMYIYFTVLTIASKKTLMNSTVLAWKHLRNALALPR